MQGDSIMIFNTLKILMNDYGITQTKISEETNITRPTLLSLIRNENKSIRYDVIESICKLFNIKMSDFLIFSKLDIRLGKIEMYSVEYHDTEDLVIENDVFINNKRYIFSHDIKNIKEPMQDHYEVILNAYLKSEEYYYFVENNLENTLTTLIKLKSDYEKIKDDIFLYLNKEIFNSRFEISFKYSISKDPHEFNDARHVIEKIKELDSFNKSMIFNYLQKELGDSHRT